MKNKKLNFYTTIYFKKCKNPLFEQVFLLSIYNIYDFDIINSIKYGDKIEDLPVELTVDNTIKELI